MQSRATRATQEVLSYDRTNIGAATDQGGPVDQKRCSMHGGEMAATAWLVLGLVAWVLIGIPFALLVGRMIWLRDNPPPSGSGPS